MKTLIGALLCSLGVSVGVLGPIEEGAAAPVVFNIIDADADGEGFNDPAAFVPVGGNMATTLGQARLNALQFAADIWGKLLIANYTAETINVLATFDPLGGTAFSATGGTARPGSVFADFSGLPGSVRSDTWYASALANHLHGSDLAPDDPKTKAIEPRSAEIEAVFNTDVDNSTVLGNVDFYYGFDGANQGADIDFVTVALHELTHGLGFASVVDIATGAFSGGRPSVYDRLVCTTPCTGSSDLFGNLTDAERLAAIGAGLQWIGTFGAFGNSLSHEGPLELDATVAHLDPLKYGDELMRPEFGLEVIHASGNITIGMLQDMGWRRIPEPATILLVAASLGALAFTGRRNPCARPAGDRS